MYKRVCLITPPSEFLMDQRVFMNLGILKVAALLKAGRGIHSPIPKNVLSVTVKKSIPGFKPINLVDRIRYV